MLLEKGIEDAINGVITTNNEFNLNIVGLDIYGEIDSNYLERFEQIKKNWPVYIKYCGIVSPNNSVKILNKYDVLLFPTYYEGEGLAGTLIDAYAAGLPIVATRWKYNAEFIDKSIGFLVNIRSPEEISKTLIYICKHKYLLNEMSLSSRFRYEEFETDSVVRNIINLMTKS